MALGLPGTSLAVASVCSTDGLRARPKAKLDARVVEGAPLSSPLKSAPMRIFEAKPHRRSSTDC
jgi:hypothetical protein